MTKTTPTITLLMPTYNEIEGLKLVWPRIDKSLFDDIFIIDGGSTDGTVEFAKVNNIRIERQERKGIHGAVLDAIAKIKTDYIIELSPDNNCIPEQLPDIITKINEGYELVVVSRYLPPAKSEDDGLITAFGNWMFSQLTRYLGKFPVTDALTIYRGYRTDMVEKYNMEKYTVGPVFEPLVSAMANLQGLKYCEIPGDEPKRIGGVSKMSVIYNGSTILLMLIRLYIKKIGMIVQGR